MSLKKRLTAVGVIAVAAALTFGVAKSGRQITEKRENTVFNNGKETLYLWYTDEALSSYLSSAAVAYSETHGAGDAGFRGRSGIFGEYQPGIFGGGSTAGLIYPWP